MRSLCILSVVTSFLCGCISMPDGNSVDFPTESADAIVPVSAQEPCPAPLVAPTEKSTEMSVAPSESTEVVVIEENAPAQFEETAPLSESTPAPSEAPSAPAPEGQPDARSHIDVDGIPPEIPDRRDYFVTTGGLNVRAAPSAQSRVVRRLKLGEKVTSYGREGIWVQIAQDEYVSIIYLSDRAVSENGDN